MEHEPLILAGSLAPDALAGHVAVVTGAGGGIGFEASRSLLSLGARVVIAEVDRSAGRLAVARLSVEFGSDRAIFVRTDVGDERSVRGLVRHAKTFGDVDIVINNATIAALGAVKDVPIAEWDTSYRVNLRGPVLLARAFLPSMIARKWGVFACVSSVGQAYMAPYEALKAAQVHLATTLATELDGTGVATFTIGPGFVPTQTASSAIPRLAALMGQSAAELRALLTAHTISVEAAGAGFAAAVAMADRYRGQEISSVQALVDAGIEIPTQDAPSPARELSADQMAQVSALCSKVRTTLAEQATGWKERNPFERQWMIRTFKTDARMSVEAWLGALDEMQRHAEAGRASDLLAVSAPLDALAGHYRHVYELAKGYIKDPAQRETELAIVQGWRDDVMALMEALAS